MIGEEKRDDNGTDAAIACECDGQKPQSEQLTVVSVISRAWQVIFTGLSFRIQRQTLAEDAPSTSVTKNKFAGTT